MELEVAGVALRVPVPSLPGGASHLVAIALPTGRRAVVELGPMRAVRGDVFGLIRRVVQWPVHRQVFVHPRTVRPGSSLPGYRARPGGRGVDEANGERPVVPHPAGVRARGRPPVHPLESPRPATAPCRSGNSCRRTDRWSPSCCPAAGRTTTGPRSATSRPGCRGPGEFRRGAGDAEDADVPSTDSSPGGVEIDDPGAARRSPQRRSRRGRRRGVRGRRQLRGVDGRGAGPAAAGGRHRRRRHRIRGATADGVLDQFCAVDAAAESPDLVFETRRVGAPVPPGVAGGAGLRLRGRSRAGAGGRAGLPGGGLACWRCGPGSSPRPHPSRLTGSDAYSVLTVDDVDALPAARSRVGRERACERLAAPVHVGQGPMSGRVRGRRRARSDRDRRRIVLAARRPGDSRGDGGGRVGAAGACLRQFGAGVGNGVGRGDIRGDAHLDRTPAMVRHRRSSGHHCRCCRARCLAGRAGGPDLPGPAVGGRDGRGDPRRPRRLAGTADGRDPHRRCGGTAGSPADRRGVGDSVAGVAEPDPPARAGVAGSGCSPWWCSRCSEISWSVPQRWHWSPACSWSPG